jgi:hypothetical protein
VFTIRTGLFGQPCAQTEPAEMTHTEATAKNVAQKRFMMCSPGAWKQQWRKRSPSVLLEQSGFVRDKPDDWMR